MKVAGFKNLHIIKHGTKFHLAEKVEIKNLPGPSYSFLKNSRPCNTRAEARELVREVFGR